MICLYEVTVLICHISLFVICIKEVDYYYYLVIFLHFIDSEDSVPDMPPPARRGLSRQPSAPAGKLRRYANSHSCVTTGRALGPIRHKKKSILYLPVSLLGFRFRKV